MAPLVTTIIPTFNRRADVVVAVRSALSQTYLCQEVLVVDDGSTDGTLECLQAEFGTTLRVFVTGRLGVSGARNRGIAAARGDYIALLDSDDEWLPGKVEAQVAFLEARPTFGMVLTDVAQMDRERVTFEVLRRRVALPEDGDVLRHVLRQPALVPSSAMFRRQVFEDVGMFDTTLTTAEDIDFHLRVAARWKIGVISQPLTRAMRGHDGLSALTRTYSDYLGVLDRFTSQHQDIPATDRRAGRWAAMVRNLRGLIVSGNAAEARVLGARALRNVRSLSDVRDLLRLAPVTAKVIVRQMLG